MTSNPFRTLRARMHLVVMVAIFATVLLGGMVSAHAATYDPLNAISNDNMRAYNSMSEKEIQAFLNTQAGPLKSLVTADYDKVITLSKTKNNLNTTPDRGETPKPASKIIWEACQAWDISPKVMLVMLQKEQSLLTRTTLGPTTLARALGAGCPGSLVDPKNNPVATNRYPGFGNQVWHSARLLSSYGETNPSFPDWSVGKRVQICNPGFSADWVYHKRVWRPSLQKYVTLHYIAPKNLATYKLYLYNPSIGASPPFGDLSGQSCAGNANFWKIYSRYFGSPLADPRMQPVYRFRSRVNGTYIYTTSIAEKVKLRQASYAKRWIYEGSKFKVDSSVPTTQTTPLYRFRNKNTGKYSFTVSKAKYDYRRSAQGRKTWSYDGVAFRISKKASTGAVTVWKFKNRKTGAFFFTHSKAVRDKYRTQSPYTTRYRYDGVAFYLPRYQTP